MTSTLGYRIKNKPQVVSRQQQTFDPAFYSLILLAYRQQPELFVLLSIFEQAITR